MVQCPLTPLALVSCPPGGHLGEYVPLFHIPVRWRGVRGAQVPHWVQQGRRRVGAQLPCRLLPWGVSSETPAENQTGGLGTRQIKWKLKFSFSERNAWRVASPSTENTVGRRLASCPGCGSSGSWRARLPQRADAWLWSGAIWEGRHLQEALAVPCPCCPGSEAPFPGVSPLSQPQAAVSRPRAAQHRGVWSASSPAAVGTLSLRWRLEAKPGGTTDFVRPAAALPANSSASKRAAQAHGLRRQE